MVGADGDAVGDAVGDGAGLAGASAGEHAQGPLQVLGDGALVRVEGVEQLGGAQRPPGLDGAGGVGGVAGLAHRSQPATAH